MKKEITIITTVELKPNQYKSADEQITDEQFLNTAKEQLNTARNIINNAGDLKWSPFQIESADNKS